MDTPQIKWVHYVLEVQSHDHFQYMNEAFMFPNCPQGIPRFPTVIKIYRKRTAKNKILILKKKQKNLF